MHGTLCSDNFRSKDQLITCFTPVLKDTLNNHAHINRLMQTSVFYEKDESIVHEIKSVKKKIN